MKKEIKEYGSDLLKQHRELEQKQKSLRNKVIKRMCYLLDNSDSPYLDGFVKDNLEYATTEVMLFVIVKVEDEYINKNKQLDLFDNE